MRLPDGRVFDLIFSVGSPDQRWQTLDVSGPGGPPAAGDPFALEPGPLTPIDESGFPLPAPQPVFEPLVAGALQELGAAGGALDGAHANLTEAAAPGDLDALLAGEIGGAASTLDAQLRAADAFVPSDVAARSQGQATTTGAHEGRYQEPMPGGHPPRPKPFPGPLTPVD
jgi:hypothetical protein